MGADGCDGRWWFPIELNFTPSDRPSTIALTIQVRDTSNRTGIPSSRSNARGRGAHFTPNRRHLHPLSRSSGSVGRERRFPRCESLRHSCSCDAYDLFKMGIEAVVEGDGGEERPEVMQKCVGRTRMPNREGKVDEREGRGSD